MAKKSTKARGKKAPKKATTRKKPAKPAAKKAKSTAKKNSSKKPIKGASKAKSTKPTAKAKPRFNAHLSASSNRRKSFTIKAPSIPQDQRDIPMKTLLETDEIADEIMRILREALTPQSISLANHSGDHAHHAESRKGGGGHYALKVTSEAFEGLGLKERQMWVTQALRELFEQKKIHALTMTLKSPSEEPLPRP